MMYFFYNFNTCTLEYSILVILQCTCITASLPRLTINGEWSPWSKIKSECVRLNETDHVIQSGITCGGGVRFLERSCTNPKPQVYSMFRNTLDECNKKIQHWLRGTFFAV